jgi:uncharacterized protein (UPF0179 family)
VTQVTLIGEKLAKEGNEFIYNGPNNECRNCKLKTVCFNLKQAREYRIIKVRDKQHSCNVHEGKVVVVEVNMLPIFASIDKKISEGSETKINKIECKNIGCDFFKTCVNNVIIKDKKYVIKKYYEKIDCAEDLELYLVELAD